MAEVTKVSIDGTSYDIQDSTAQAAVSVLEPSASATDVGKYLKVKTVADGKVTEYEFGSGGGGGGGTDDYIDLVNKPSINSITLTGNKSLSDIGAASQSAFNDLNAMVAKDVSISMTNSTSLANLAAYDGLTKTSATNLATYTPSTSPSVSPSIRDYCSLGEKKWLVGFKYKITKLDNTLGDPECIRLFLGNSLYIDSAVVYDEWVEVSEIASVNLTRVYLILRNYATAPTAGQLKIEVKDYFVYDISDISNGDLVNYIANRQNTNYTDGTVSYSFEDFSDKLKQSLNQINVKNYGVVGDGITDDTTAIKRLLSEMYGNFYFPAGTYKITGTIEIPGNSVLYGDGDSTVIDMSSCDGLLSCVFRSEDTSYFYPYILARHDNTVIRKIKLVGNDTTHEDRHAGIAIMDAENCIVGDCTVYNINCDVNQSGSGTANVSGYGIMVTRSKNVNVERCYVEKCGYECIGVVDDCDCCVVRDCYTKDGYRCCIQVHRGSSNVLVENCYMKQTNDKYHSCFTVHGLENQECKNLRVMKCTMELTQNGSQPYDYCAPLQIMSYADKILLMGNIVFGGKRALYITTSTHDAKVIGNDLACNDDSDYGVYITSSNAIIIGNKLVNEASEPVNTFASNGQIIFGNIGIGDTVYNASGVSF